MKRLLALTAAAFALTTASALAQQAPDKRDAHDGHDHSAHSTPIPMDLANMPEGVFTEVDTDHTLGAVDAPVTLIVFASVTCPHCASWFADDYPVIKRDYIDTGKVRMVFREFPTPPMQVAVAGFLIADCGPEASYMDAIVHQMANQEATLKALQAGMVQETLESLGAAAGLTPAQTESCLTSQAGYDALNATVARARAAGLQSVPSMMINGTLYPSRDTSAAALSTAIDAAIEG